MHAVATICALVGLSQLGQIGGYDGGGYGDTSSQPDLGPRTTISAAPSRRPRATSPQQYGDYPAARTASAPRYGDTVDTTLPPVGGSNQLAREDQHSALATKLLRDLLTPTRGDENVQSLRLVDALGRTQGSQQQFPAIKAYWDWCLAVAELRGVVDEDAVLRRAPAPRSAPDQAMHAALVRASTARLEDSQLDVAAKLVELQDTTGQRSRDALRPADVPFVSTYNTNFSKIFPNTNAPVTLRKIHQTLPYGLRVIRTRADSYASARQALTTVEEAYGRTQASYADLQDALSLVRNQRRAFLDSVHDYNFAIAEYALSVGGPSLNRETVVSMLIRSSASPYRGASLDYNTGVVPASGLLPATSSESLIGTTWDTQRITLPEPPPFEASSETSELKAMPDFARELGNMPVRRLEHAVITR